jgi:predicted dehydrogenase
MKKNDKLCGVDIGLEIESPPVASVRIFVSDSIQPREKQSISVRQAFALLGDNPQPGYFMAKIGIVGFGKMGRIRAKSLETCGATIAAVCDVDPIDDTDYKVLGSPADIIGLQEIDAVVLCLPNYLNYPTTLAALRAGKHVFCEKPPAFTADQVRDIQRVEGASGKVLMYGFNHRHHEAVLRMKEIVDSGVYGKILWMRGRYGKSVDSSYLGTWRADEALAGGGILIDQGIHMLDLFLHLGARFDEVHAFVSSLFWQIDGIEDNVFAIMKNTESGLVASLHSTMTQWRHLFSLEVFLESGYMVLNGLKTSSGTYGDEELTIAKNRTKAPAATWDDEERFVFHTDSSWDKEAAHFLAAVDGESKVVYGTSSDALEVMQLVESIYEHEHSVSEDLNIDLKSIHSSI